MKWLIPDHIAPSPEDTEAIRWEGVVGMCDYYVWYINVRVARIQAICARFGL